MILDDIEDILDRIRYQFSVYRSYILYGKISLPFRLIAAWFEVNMIERRLEKDGYNDSEIIEILTRFVRYKKYQDTRDTREVIKEVYKMIADVADRAGMPQWELKEIIRRDFDLDL